MDLIMFLIGVLGLGISILKILYDIVNKNPKKIGLIGIATSVTLCITGITMRDLGYNKHNEIDYTNYTNRTTSTYTETVTSDRKTEIEKYIRDRIGEGDYDKVEIETITINNNLSIEEQSYYIALIYLDFKAKNGTKTANEMMKMYSDDLVATLADEGIKDISEVSIFLKDEYNNRDLTPNAEFSHPL